MDCVMSTLDDGDVIAGETRVSTCMKALCVRIIGNGFDRRHRIFLIYKLSSFKVKSYRNVMSFMEILIQNYMLT